MKNMKKIKTNPVKLTLIDKIAIAISVIVLIIAIVVPVAILKQNEIIEKVSMLLPMNTHGMSLKKFRTLLVENIRDPKVVNLLGSGLYDGYLDDDKIPVVYTFTPINQLKPTQSEIDLKFSLKRALEDFPEKSVEMVLGTYDVFDDKDFPPILTAKAADETVYIIDGHHRWSQVFLISQNIEQNMRCLQMNFEAEGVNNPLDILKITYLAQTVTSAQMVQNVNSKEKKIRLQSEKVDDYKSDIFNDNFFVDTRELSIDSVDIFFSDVNNCNCSKFFKLLESKGGNKAEFMSRLRERIILIKQLRPSLSMAIERADMPQITDVNRFQYNLNKGVVNLSEPLYKNMSSAGLTTSA